MNLRDIKEIRRIFKDEISKVKNDTIKVKDLGYDDEFLNNILFEEYEKGGKTFSKEILPVLSKIDFSTVDFGSFYCIDYNFSNLKGVEIDPQTIYDKNLTKSILKGVKFIGEFSGVKINGASFKGSTGAKIDPSKIAAKSISQVDFCDVEFIGNFDSVAIGYTSFRGSKKAQIDPQLINFKSLYQCDFGDVTFIGSFKDTDIRSCDFTGSKGAIIDPQEVDELCGSIFKDVEFVGNFNNVRILGCDFTGSKGAVINPQTIWGRIVTGVIFKDVLIIGSFKGTFVKKSQLKGAKFQDYNEIFDSNFKKDFKMKIAELTNKNYIKK